MKNKSSPSEGQFRPAKKSFSDWKTETGQKMKTEREEKEALEERKRQEAKDRELLDYAVFTDHIEHRTPHLQEAINLAKSINARVFWAIEGAIAGEVEI